MARLTAQQALARFMNGGRRKAKGSAPTLAYDLGGVYVLSNGIFTPADDDLNPIIGYSENALGDLPYPLINWVEGYNLEVASLQGMDVPPTISDTRTVAKAKAAPRVSVAPLVSAKWAQNSPYNQNIKVGGKSCVAGCCAIALAQILFYWGAQGYKGRTYRRGCMATPDYKTMTDGNEVDALPPVTSFDYDLMTAAKPTTKMAKAAVAKLVEYVGKAIQSDYRPTSTGAYSTLIAPVLKDSFRMGKTIQFVQSSKVGARAFEQSIYNEISAGRPVYMDGAISATSTSGHAFVCDGYDAETDMYHFNWGWGGGYNGWFALSALTPLNKNYSFRKEAVIGIDPTTAIPGDVNGDGSVSVSDVMMAVAMANKGEYDPSADVNYDGKVDGEDTQGMINQILGK